MASTPRIVVVGGGSTGAGVARDLAMRGADVTLVEQGNLTHGTTGRMHGLLHSGGRYAVSDQKSARECIEENRVLRDIASHCVEMTGGMFVKRPEDSESYFEEKLQGCTDCDIPAEVISGERAREREPHLATDVDKAISVPDGAVDPFRLVVANAASAQEHGARIETHSKVTDLLVESGEIYEEGEFLWPAADELEFQVRVNTGTDSRSIDEVPVEEVARAIGLILREGGTMTPDDLVLETTRLFGYQRRGKRIEERIEDALSLLETEGLVDTAGRVSLVEGADPEAAILSRIYPSVPASEETDAPSDTGDGQQTESVENAESPLNSLFGHNDAGGQQTESEQNAELSLGSLFGGGDDRRLDELTALFENHLEREDPENHFVDLRFEKGGETGVYYQFLNGWHNITQLTDGEEATLEAVVDENDLTVEAEGDAFVTISGGSAEPADEALLCVRLLNSVFDVDLDDVESAAEHGDGHVGW